MAESLLAAYLRKHNETQDAFAERVGVAASTVSSWILGSRGPDIASALLVERATAGAVPIASWARRDRRRRKPASKAPKQAS